MRKDRNSNVAFSICMIAILLFTIASRFMGLTYNLSIHPDESEFYNGSKSLARSILDPDVPFVEEKEYPEGAYVLQMPFQIIKELIGSSHWFWRSAQCWSRISSVFYFALAVIYGVLILTKFMSRSKTAAILYALTMCFSLFFIEHSRYGVGDMSSLWLLMAIIYHSAQAFHTRKRRHLVSAFFCAGVMGAVKYPQLFFLTIPLGTWLSMGGKNKKRAGGVLVFLLIAFAGLMMFSPKAAVDPAYFLRVLDREGKAYVTEGTGFNSGGLINNVIGTVLYTLLYSDFPLSFLFVAGYFYKAITSRVVEGETDLFFHKLLPVITVLFFAYNLFAKLLVFRTFTPFFGLTALYASEAAGKLCHCSNQKGNKVGRAVVLALTCLMVVRGGWLLAITGHQGDDKDRFTPIFEEAVDDHWNQATLFVPYNIASEYSFEENMVCPQELSIKEMDVAVYRGENNGLTIQPGELIVTGSYEHGLNAPYFVSYAKSLTTSDDAAWEAFKQANEDYYVGQIYPDYYYYLFGGWIRGGTLSTFLMPCNMVYYRSA